MRLSPLRTSAGFTYIGALVLVVIMGIMAAKGAEVWTTKMRVEREDELIYRATQIRNAMRVWYRWAPKVVPGPRTGQVAQKAAPKKVPWWDQGPDRPALPELKALVTLPSTATKLHVLRPSMLIDPMTGKEWEVTKDPANGNRINGVFSKSEEAPIKQENFPDDLKADVFVGKKKYSDWLFIYSDEPVPKGQAGTITGLPTSSTPGSSDIGIGSDPNARGPRPPRGKGRAGDNAPE